MGARQPDRMSRELGASGAVLGDDEATRGRNAAHRLAWSEAYDLLSRPRALAGEDLEPPATAAYLLGHADECRDALQRAHHAHFGDGDRRRAARCVFWVGFTLLLEGDLAPATGWLARAQRLLDDEPPDCAEAGLMLIPVALQVFPAAGDHASAEAAAAPGGCARLAVR